MPRCGDGIVDYFDPVLLEICDEGPLNGTPQGLCTKECDPGIAHPWNLDGVPLDMANAKRLLGMRFYGSPLGGIAFTAFDDQGVHVVRELLVGHTPTYVTLKVASAPIAFGRVDVGDLASFVPIWVEASGGTLHMYYANVPLDGPPEIHEVPYPFPDGTRPQLIASRGRATALLIDQSSEPPYDLLSALILIRGPDDIHTITARVPAPGVVRGVALETTEQDLHGNEPFIEQVVQFFDDTHTFVALEDREPPNPWNTDYQLYEAGRGDWPFRVVGGASWQEAGEYPGDTNDPEINSRPTPLMVLTDTGDLYAWKFNHGISGETSVTPFGHVMPGSRNVGSAFYWEGSLSAE